jgi:hypothetical protein
MQQPSANAAGPGERQGCASRCRPTKDERRFECTMLGAGSDLKRKAWSEAAKLARVN